MFLIHLDWYPDRGWNGPWKSNPSQQSKVTSVNQLLYVHN